MAGSIDDWFLNRQLSSLGDHLDDEVVEWQAPWDVLPAQPPAPRADQVARAGRRMIAGRDAVAGRPKLKRDKSTGGSAAPLPIPKPPVVPTAVRRQIQAAIRENPGEGSKRIAATLRATGVSVTKAQVSEVRRQMHQRAAQNRRATRRRPTGQPPRVIEPPRTGLEMPLCNACGVRVSLIGTCRCS
jgi:hypothetical protein